MVSVDAMFLALGLLGIKVSNNERITRVMLRELGQDTIHGLRGTIHNFVNATSKWDKAKQLFSIVGSVMNITMLKAILKELVDEMSWWDWTKMSVIALAQFTAWVASDGIAFIGEAALVVMTASDLGRDSVDAVTKCAD